MDGASVTAMCASLDVIDQRTNLITSFIIPRKIISSRSVLSYFHDHHAELCYLSYFEALKDANIWEILQNFSLARYAAQYMADHARQNPEDTLKPFILGIICQLLSHPRRRKPRLALLDSLDMIKSGVYNLTITVSYTR